MKRKEVEKRQIIDKAKMGGFLHSQQQTSIQEDLVAISLSVSGPAGSLVFG